MYIYIYTVIYNNIYIYGGGGFRTWGYLKTMGFNSKLI